MRNSTGATAGMVVGLALLVGLGFYACSDDAKPTEPKPDEPVDYPVYLINFTNGTIFVYHPLTREMDTVGTTYAGRYVTASADGSRLYLTGENNTVVLETGSFTPVTELPYGSEGPAVVSPDNRLVAIGSDSLVILHTADNSVCFSDTVYLYGGHAFSADSRTLYGVGTDREYLHTFLYEAALGSDCSAAVTRDSALSAVWCIRPTPDESRLLLANGSHLAMYDLAGDSLLPLVQPPECGGRVEITPDGDFAFPSSDYYPMGPYPTYVPVFDVAGRRVVDSMDVRDYLDSVGQVEHYGFGQMTVTPDGRWLVVMGFVSSGRLHLFDLGKREIVDFYLFGRNHEFMSISSPIWK
jgi:hypothetical protein